MKKIYLLLSIVIILFINIKPLTAQEVKKKDRKFNIDLISYYSSNENDYYIGALNLGYRIYDIFTVYIEGAMSEDVKINSKTENTKYLLLGLEIDQHLTKARFIPSFGFGMANGLNNMHFDKTKDVMFFGLKFMNEIEDNFYWGLKTMYIRHDWDDSLFNFGVILGYKF